MKGTDKKKRPLKSKFKFQDSQRRQCIKSALKCASIKVAQSALDSRQGQLRVARTTIAAQA